MSTQTTNTLTREEIERVISDVIGTMRVTIERYGSPSGDPSEVYGWIYDNEDEHPQRSTPDALFDPEAEGRTKDEDSYSGNVWMSPGERWFYRVPAIPGAEYELNDDCDPYAVGKYHGTHPTTALVHEIIRQNGGDA